MFRYYPVFEPAFGTAWALVLLFVGPGLGTFLIFNPILNWISRGCNPKEISRLYSADFSSTQYVILGFFVVFIGYLMRDPSSSFGGAPSAFLFGVGGLIVLFQFIKWANSYQEHRKEKHQDELNRIDKKLECAIATIPDFTPSLCFHSKSKDSFIAADENRRKIVIGRVDESSNEFMHTIIETREIMSVEIIEDGTSISRLSGPATRVAAGAVVGNALLGETGAIVGAIAGSAHTKTEIDGIQLRFWLDNLAKPFEIFSFSKRKININSHDYKTVKATAERWLAIVRILTDREVKATAQKEFG